MLFLDRLSNAGQSLAFLFSTSLPKLLIIPSTPPSFCFSYTGLGVDPISLYLSFLPSYPLPLPPITGPHSPPSFFSAIYVIDAIIFLFFFFFLF